MIQADEDHGAGATAHWLTKRKIPADAQRRGSLPSPQGKNHDILPGGVAFTVLGPHRRVEGEKRGCAHGPYQKAQALLR